MSWRPLTAERWPHYQRMTAVYDEAGVQHTRPRDEGEVIRRNVDWLLDRLYEADEENGYRASSRAIGALMLDHEAINWGDLGCVEVNRDDGQWCAYIEEAADDSPNLRAYVAGWLQKWGWNVEVETSW